MKIIDWGRRGNLIRLYLGSNSLTTWTGEHWHVKPYEHNAGRVNKEFIRSIVDIAIPWRFNVYEPCDCSTNPTPWSKDDIRDKRVPFLIVIPVEDSKDVWSWDLAGASAFSKRFYLGDSSHAFANIAGSIIFWNQIE